MAPKRKEKKRKEKKRKEKKRKEKKRKEKKRKEKKRKEKKRKEKTTPFGVNLMRSQVLYQAAQVQWLCLLCTQMIWQFHVDNIDNSYHDLMIQHKHTTSDTLQMNRRCATCWSLAYRCWVPGLHTQGSGTCTQWNRPCKLSAVTGRHTCADPKKTWMQWCALQETMPPHGVGP